MTRGFEAIRNVNIDAPPERVWKALTDPDEVKAYMHGTDLSTDWTVGSPVTWSGVWKGEPYVDKGTILQVEPERLLRMTHWSPMGGSEDRPENYHTLTYELAGHGRSTTLTLTQDNNPTQAEADAMAENNWAPVLEGLKQTAER